MNTDTIPVEDDAEQSRTIAELQAAGYRILDTQDNVTALAGPSPGSLLVHFALLAVTLGVGNIIYYLYNQTRRRKVRVVVEG